MTIRSLVFLFLLATAFPVFSQSKGPDRQSAPGRRVYHLVLDYKTVNITGRPVRAMTINNSLPAPQLTFRQGEKAVIYVKNLMDVESSLHWHGILLPNFEDGVPYLTTPPIKPGKTHKFEFEIKQAPGTYWYHSHTGLQEQRGLYGAFVIEDRDRPPAGSPRYYDQDLPLVLSDWTNEDPWAVMRSLKRHSPWPSIKKGTALGLFQILKGGVFGSWLSLKRQRMPDMDISDVYYDAFLINGKARREYRFPAGAKIRLRVINASASTYFHLLFGGRDPLLVSADGVDVRPIRANKVLQAVAETYDFIIEIPKAQALEFKATAQDGSGSATALIGALGGPVLKAPFIPPPDPIEAIKSHAGHGSHAHSDSHSDGPSHDGHHGGKPHPTHESKESSSPSHGHHGGKPLHREPQTSSHTSGHRSLGESSHGEHRRHIGKQSPSSSRISEKTLPDGTASARGHDQGHEDSLSGPANGKQKDPALPDRYPHLRSLEKTDFSSKLAVKEIKLDLTGNMWRYVWSFNGKSLSESDKIKVKKTEVLRIILNNRTMMHHPLHLHGHFFRVLNRHSAHSPLKHTVDVPPMEKTVIEFLPDVPGDWIFHCHILYHMKAGMSRVFSHGDVRDLRMEPWPAEQALNSDRQWFFYGEGAFLSNRLSGGLTAENTRNKVLLSADLSWFKQSFVKEKNFELEISYERFLSDFFRLYTAFELENQSPGFSRFVSSATGTAYAGLRWLLPYFVDGDLSLSHRTDLRLAFDYELALLPRLEFFASVELSARLGILLRGKSSGFFHGEYHLGLEYLLDPKFSLLLDYENSRYGFGAGFAVRM